jgi:hypothetical protein
LLVCLLALPGAGGCSRASSPVSLEYPKQGHRNGDYPRVLARWTRSAKVVKLEDLDTSIKVHATCHSPDFISAYVARYEHLFKISGRERRELLQRMNHTWEEGAYPFVVAAATTDYRHNDFDQQDSVWRISLVNDMEQQVAPMELRAFRRVTATVREFYPYARRFYRVYYLRFPKRLSDGTPLVRKGTRYLSLRFSGPLGRADLIWKLR